MKTLLRNITNVSLNKRGLTLGWLLLSGPAYSFQLETPATASSLSGLSDFEKMEAGLAQEGDVVPTFYYLGQGAYAKALDALTPEVERLYPWMRSYLENLLPVFTPLEKRESPHFMVSALASELFLADYALPSLEKSAKHIETLFGHRPKGKIRVEIYPTKEAFSKASTLSLETLERSGAIGICKFHRLMILSPQALPLGYRWMDALSHEYMHLLINELSESKAELWFHEGTARYFETSYRTQPPDYLTPHQQTALLDALENNTLISFERMSPSMVYLKNQDEVSLAFAQVSFAVDKLIQEKKTKTFVGFLKSLRKTKFSDAFQKSFGWDLPAFQDFWEGKLKNVSWQKSKGTMSDEVQFQAMDEMDVVGADVQGLLRIADRMRKQGHLDAALLEYEKALLEEPDNALLLLKAARTHLALNQREDAKVKLLKATQKNPNYGTTHLELAKLLSGKEALFHYLEANAINPFDPEVHEGLRKVYSDLGQGQEAQQEEAVLRLLRR